MLPDLDAQGVPVSNRASVEDEFRHRIVVAITADDSLAAWPKRDFGKPPHFQRRRQGSHDPARSGSLNVAGRATDHIHRADCCSAWQPGFRRLRRRPSVTGSRQEAAYSQNQTGSPHLSFLLRNHHLPHCMRLVPCGLRLLAHKVHAGARCLMSFVPGRRSSTRRPVASIKLAA